VPDSKVSLPPEPLPEIVVAIESRHLSFGALQYGQCRYALTHSSPYEFCGADVYDKFPYCLAHARLCYRSPSQRRV
jgi:hypothetical protein